MGSLKPPGLEMPSGKLIGKNPVYFERPLRGEPKKCCERRGVWAVYLFFIRGREAAVVFWGACCCISGRHFYMYKKTTGSRHNGGYTKMEGGGGVSLYFRRCMVENLTRIEHWVIGGGKPESDEESES